MLKPFPISHENEPAAPLPARIRLCGSIGPDGRKRRGADHVRGQLRRW